MLSFLTWGHGVDLKFTAVSHRLNSLREPFLCLDVRLDARVGGSPVIDKLRAKRVLQELLVGLPREVLLVVPDFKVVQVLQDFFTFEIADYHRVNALRFSLLDKVIVFI